MPEISADEYLWIEGLRTFGEGRYIPIRPLTILIGENSTGKTSLLAAHRLAWDAVSSYRPARFNEDPFFLGAYEEVASSRQRGQPQLDHIGVGVMGRSLAQIGQHHFATTAFPSVGLTAEFVKGHSQPEMNVKRLYSGDHKIELRVSESNREFEIVLGAPSATLTFAAKDRGFGDLAYIGFYAAEEALYSSDRSRSALRGTSLRQVRTSAKLSREDRGTLEMLLATSFGVSHVRGSHAIAPVRTKPQRTYDPIVVQPEPEGGHIPLLLARSGLKSDAEAKQLIKAISGFGKASGLFDGIDIKHLGKTESSPFQLRVRLGRAKINVVDVGYGVSQVLPIVVESILQRHRTILLQQPEVHLHPKAQAALGTFIGNLASAGQRFIIETHSDFFIDRIRMDIRDGGGLRPEDVMVLYLTRSGRESSIHAMEIGPNGDFVAIPDGYRAFFDAETLRFLGA